MWPHYNWENGGRQKFCSQYYSNRKVNCTMSHYYATTRWVTWFPFIYYLSQIQWWVITSSFLVTVKILLNLTHKLTIPCLMQSNLIAPLLYMLLHSVHPRGSCTLEPWPRAAFTTMAQIHKGTLEPGFPAPSSCHPAPMTVQRHTGRPFSSPLAQGGGIWTWVSHIVRECSNPWAKNKMGSSWSTTSTHTPRCPLPGSLSGDRCLTPGCREVPISERGVRLCSHHCG